MTPLLEREHELFGLQKAAEDAAKGRGQVVHLAGEAGIGKSRLIAEFLDQLAEGTIAATGNCQSFDTPRPLGPLFDMSLSLGPSFKDIVKAAVYDSDPFAELARAISAIGPGVVLVFEDAQYADAASLDVIDFLCQRIAVLKALIIISYRSDEISSDHPLTVLLGRCPSRFTSRITLGPISEPATREMAQVLGSSSDTIFSRANGNPFLTLKLLRDGSVQSGLIPQAIIQWAIARLAMTEPEQKNWVKLLAYCPAPVDRVLQERLADACGFRREILPGCNGFLTSAADGAVIFRHEIVREALVAGLSDIDREHGQARLLEVLCADDKFAQLRGELVTSVAQAVGAADMVVKYTRYAVCQAEARGAYAEAAQYLQRALPFAKRIGPEAHAEIAELLVCRTSVSEPITEAMLSEIAQANALWRRHDKPGPLARNHLLLCRLYRYKADRELAQKHLSNAIDLLEGDLALALAIQAQMLLEERHNDEAFAVALEATKKARAADDRASRIDAWVTIAVTLQRRQKRRGKAMIAVCRTLADRWNLHELRARICASMCDEALAAMDLPGAERCVAEWGAVRCSAPECWKAALDGREALVLMLRGKLDEGEALASRVLNGNRTTASMRFPATLALALGRSRREAVDAEESLAEAELLAKAIGDPRNVTLARLGQIEHAFLEGRVEDALAICRADGADNSDCDQLDTGRLMRQWRTRLQWIIYGEQDDVSNAAGRTTSSNADPGEVAAELAELGYAFKAALAKLFVVGPDSSRLFSEAVAEFSAIGAKAGLSCTHRMAEAHGISLERIKRERGPYRAARSHPLGLTRREVEILRMIVDGAGNKDIADKVGRSLRTVEHHVSAILGKMSLENRIQAVLFALANPAILEPAEEFA